MIDGPDFTKTNSCVGNEWFSVSCVALDTPSRNNVGKADCTLKEETYESPPADDARGTAIAFATCIKVKSSFMSVGVRVPQR